MRIVFLGNVADYSPAFLHALVRRSTDPDDALSVAAVICPAGHRTNIESAAFATRRAAGRALDRLGGRPAGLTDGLVARGSGIHRTMQRLAHRCGAPILWPTDMSSPDLCARVAALEADLTLVAGLDRLLRGPTLDAFPTSYNVHPSLLPDFRGAVPEFWQLDCRSNTGGVTIHRIDRDIDTGPIVLQRSFAIEPWFDAADLTARSVDVGIELVDELLDDLDASARTQGAGSYQPIPSPDFRTVPVGRPASGVFDRARALGFATPLSLHLPASAWSASQEVAACEPSGSSVRLQLFDPVVHADVSSRPPGTVLRTVRDTAVVWCSGGAVEFRRVVVQGSSVPEHGSTT